MFRRHHSQAYCLAFKFLGEFRNLVKGSTALNPTRMPVYCASRNYLLLFAFFAVVLLFPLTSTADVIYVDAHATGANAGTSWSDAYVNLRTGMINAQPNEEIWVTADMYKPTTNGDRDSTFKIRDQLDMYGGLF
jgi:hypothetical protein